jgi:hypothetical protein
MFKQNQNCLRGFKVSMFVLRNFIYIVVHKGNDVDSGIKSISSLLHCKAIKPTRKGNLHISLDTIATDNNVQCTYTNRNHADNILKISMETM